MPERSPHVPDDATYIAPLELWVAGPLEGHAPITGRQRQWYREGQLLAELNWKNGVLHGAAKTYSYESLRVEVGVPQGPPNTTRAEAEFVNGECVQARFFGPVADDAAAEDTELASVELKQGALHGRVTWLTAAHGSLSAPIFEFGELVLRPRELFVPRRLPHTHRIEADFERGEPVEVRAFDAAGQRVLAPPPVVAWGQAVQREELAGYLASGAFARDLAAFFREREPAAPIDEDAARAPVVFKQLPAPHRAAALAFDELVRTGAVPSMADCSLSGYGFDCVKNDLYNANDKKYFGLAYDAYGDLYLLDVENGRVLRWAHDRDPFEDGEEFESLDAFAWAMLRLELCSWQRIAATDLGAAFQRLGFGWLGLPA